MFEVIYIIYSLAYYFPSHHEMTVDRSLAKKQNKKTPAKTNKKTHK